MKDRVQGSGFRVQGSKIRSPSIFYFLFSIFYLLSFAGCAPQTSQVKSEIGQPPEASGRAATTIERIDVSGSKVVVEASRPLFYTAFRLPDPSRLIIDIPDADMEKVGGHLIIGNDFVTKITKNSYKVGGEAGIGRIEVGLKDGVDYDIKLEGTKLIVYFMKSSPPVKVEEKVVVQDIPKEKVEASPPEARVETSKASEIVKIEPREGETTVIKVIANGPVTDYNSFVLDDPTRLVVDLWGVRNSIVGKEVEVGGPHINRVRIGEYPEKTRLVFDSSGKELPPYNVEKVDNTLLIIAGAKKVTAGQEEARLPSPSEKTPSSPDVSGIYEAPPKERYIQVKGVDFTPGKEMTRVVVTTSEKADYKLVKSMDGKVLALELKGSIIPDELKRTLDTSALNTPVVSISSFQARLSPAKDVRVLIKLKEMMTYQVSQEEGRIYIDFPVPPEVKVSEAKPVERQITAPPAEQVAKKTTPASKETPVKTTVLTPLSQGGEQAKVSSAKERGGTPARQAPETPDLIRGNQGQAVQRYTGRRLSLDFKDADIGNILRLIAEVSQLNIIADEDVKGKITIRLVDVPWDQAFDIILKGKGLGKVQEDNVVRVMPLTRIKQEEEALLAARKAKEKLEDLEVRLVQVNYATAKGMESQVKGLLSDRGSVTTEDRTNTLIIKDIRANIEKAVDLIKKLDTATPQVLIETRIVEAESSFARDLGVQWGIARRNLGAHEFTSVFGSTGTAPSATLTPTGFIGSGGQFSSQPNFAVNLPATGTAGPLGALGFAFGKVTGDPMLLDLRLSAGEKKGLTRTISRPKITTLDNKEAKISQGDSVPFETTSASGTQTQFIDATLELNVTPHITPDGSVMMKIKASRNSIGSFRSAAGTPSISKKEATTEIIVKDGETAVIGGIIISDKSDSTSGLPYFKDVPVLGWLFGSKSVSDTQKELLIFITPTILKERPTG